MGKVTLTGKLWQIVGPKEIKDKTVELNTASDLKEGVSVSANTNTCIVEKPQEFFWR